MNRKKVRKMLDSVAAQMTADTDNLVMTLNEIKHMCETAMSKGEPLPWPTHYEIVKKVNRAIRLAQA